MTTGTTDPTFAARYARLPKWARDLFDQQAVLLEQANTELDELTMDFNRMLAGSVAIRPIIFELGKDRFGLERSIKATITKGLGDVPVLRLQANRGFIRLLPESQQTIEVTTL